MCQCQNLLKIHVCTWKRMCMYKPTCLLTLLQLYINMYLGVNSCAQNWFCMPTKMHAHNEKCVKLFTTTWAVTEKLQIQQSKTIKTNAFLNALHSSQRPVVNSCLRENMYAVCWCAAAFICNRNVFGEIYNRFMK